MPANKPCSADLLLSQRRLKCVSDRVSAPCRVAGVDEARPVDNSDDDDTDISTSSAVMCGVVWCFVRQ